MKRYLPFVIIAVVLIIAVVAGIALWKSSKQSQEQPPGQSFAQSTPQASPSLPTQATQTPQPPPVQLPPDNPHARGGLNAKVTLDEYGDYQCPPCGALYPELKTLEKDYGDQVRFVFHQFPLPTVHKHAELAARAAEAAGLQGKF